MHLRRREGLSSLFRRTDLTYRVGNRHSLPLQHFNLTQIRYDILWLLSLSSYLPVLQITGKNYPSWWTTSEGEFQNS